MLLLNYLARKGPEAGMVAGFTVSVPWNAMKSTASLEEPLNWLLFNARLTRGLLGNTLRSEEGLRGVWLYVQSEEVRLSDPQR